jgi:ribosomal protein L44E
MPQHHTRNTVSTSKFCNICGKMTQHVVADRRVGHCLEHDAGLRMTKKQQELREKLKDAESQPDLFQGG